MLESSVNKEVFEDSYNYTFPALKGIQAGREFYVAMCPLKLVPRIFIFEGGDVPAELRAQRTLNKARVPEIARYITQNPRDYVFSSLTASIDRQVHFESIGNQGSTKDAGRLIVPMRARIIINDGQHRRAAIEEALKFQPTLGDESISIVFFLDAGLKRSQQMFSDLNKHAIRPTRSLGILYDNRDPFSILSRVLVEKVPLFKGLTEMEKTTISNRSPKLFTLSTIYQATRALLGKENKKSLLTKQDENITLEFWTELPKHIPEWQFAIDKKVSCAELRHGYVHAHGIAPHALGRAGHDLISLYPNNWKKKLSKISGLDWHRSNTKLWEGRAMIGGRIGKTPMNVILTANVLKSLLGLELNTEEKRYEKLLSKGKLPRFI